MMLILKGIKMKKQLLTGALALGTLTGGFMMQVNPAEAMTFEFQNIFPNSGNTNVDTFVNQFSLDVTDAGSNQVLFKVNYNDGSVDADSNDAPLASFIRQVFFDDSDGNANINAFLSSIVFSSANSSAGVDYTVSSPGGNFPQGNNVIPPFPNGASDFEANRVSGSGNSNAINPGEFGAFLASLNSGVDYNSVISALQSGQLRVGLHVQGLANDGSDSIVTGPGTPIPTPALLPGLIGTGFAAWRKRKTNQSEANA